MTICGFWAWWFEGQALNRNTFTKVNRGAPGRQASSLYLNTGYIPLILTPTHRKALSHNFSHWIASMHLGRPNGCRQGILLKLREVKCSDSSKSEQLAPASKWWSHDLSPELLTPSLMVSRHMALVCQPFPYTHGVGNLGKGGNEMKSSRFLPSSLVN